MKRIGIVVAGAAAAVLLVGSAASAHECYIANRSATGNAAATHSGRWVVLTVEDLAGLTPPSTDQACFIASWTDNGGPASFTVRSNKTIGEGSANPNLANGKGLEHAEDVFGDLFEAAIGACS